ncbi:hypothetical protein IH981_04040, partial [Patescibacteria group bacterium]|nr:hypothetical protein [Patescibacteria group bacterium]
MEDGTIREIVAREIGIFECARPAVTPDIDAVIAFSGPGTVCEPLSTDDQDWMEWFDFTRVIRGISIVLKVTAMRLNIPYGEVTAGEVEKAGPYFIYNGVDSKSENQDLVAYLSLPRSRIPESRLVVVTKINENGSVREIRHTGDQVKTFPTDMLGNEIKGAVALVSNAPHFPRILRYMEHYGRPIPKEFPIRCFPIHSDPAWAALYANSEIEAVVR